MNPLAGDLSPLQPSSGAQQQQPSALSTSGPIGGMASSAPKISDPNPYPEDDLPVPRIPPPKTAPMATRPPHEAATASSANRGRSGSPTQSPPNRDTRREAAAVSAANALSSHPQSIGAILAKVNVLQKQSQDIEKKIAELKEQRSFAAAEEQRAKTLLGQAEEELQQSKERVNVLTGWRDEHVCSANSDSYKALETLTRETKSAELRVERKEEHVQAVLMAAHDLMKEVATVKSTLKAPGDYMTLLQQRTDEQQVEVTKLASLAEDVAKLESESADNEDAIRVMRERLERAGVPIPEAPNMHRTKRLLARTKQLTDVGTRTRVLRLPVGILRALAGHLEGSVREVAMQCGVHEIAVEIQQTATLLHCHGPGVALDTLEGKIQGALSAIESEHDVGGLVTYTDAVVADTYDKAVGNIRSLLDDGRSAPQSAAGKAIDQEEADARAEPEEAKEDDNDAMVAASAKDRATPGSFATLSGGTSEGHRSRSPQAKTPPLEQ